MTKEKVVLFGYGVYVGDEVPVGAGGFGSFLSDGKIPNPKIELDDGTVVWGCECWWGPEAKVRALCKSRVVVLLNIEDERKTTAAKHAEKEKSDG